MITSDQYLGAVHPFEDVRIVALAPLEEGVSTPHNGVTRAHKFVVASNDFVLHLDDP